MAKVKKETSVNTRKVGKRTEEHAAPPKAKEPKKKRSHTVWDHHDTMIVNLRMWVERAIENLDRDIQKHAPSLVGKPKLASALSKAQELNVQLWDQIRVAQEIADAHKET